METQNTSKYEIMFILYPDLGEEQTKKEVDEVKEVITSNGGKVFFEDMWGLLDLAYKIKKEEKGYYVVLNFEMPASGLKEMEKPLNLNQRLLRYLVLKTPNNYEVKSLEEYKALAEKEKIEEEKAKEEKERKKNQGPQGPEVKKIIRKREPVKEKEPVVAEEKPLVDSKKEKEASPKRVVRPKEKLDEVDEKLKNIINNPDISL